MDRRKALKNTGAVAGGVVLFPSLLALFQSCKHESKSNWEPLFLDNDEAVFISFLIHTILPITDTPGGLDVNVDIFMDKVFALSYDEAAQSNIKSGIAAFNDRCIKSHGSVFADLSEEDKSAVLKTEESRGAKYNGGVWGTAVGKQEPISFYRSIKSMAIWAYTSSEEIGKNVLNYDPIPGEYIGCLPLSEVGNKWSF